MKLFFVSKIENEVVLRKLYDDAVRGNELALRIRIGFPVSNQLPYRACFDVSHCDDYNDLPSS